MTPETRRNVFRYGIAVDLVILATGAGMLLPPTSAILLPLFAVAVLLSVWKGKWQGGLTALVLSVVMLATMFSVGASTLVLFAVVTAIVGAAVDAMMRSRVAPVPALAEVPADEAALPLVQREDSATERQRLKAERAEAEAQVAREREAAEQERLRLEAARLEAERVQKEAEERVAREREAAEQERARLEAARVEAERVRKEADERVAREREATEQERARLEAARLEAERVRKEAEERVAREREEAGRALQERLDLERAEAERLRKEAEAVAAREREEGERERARLEAARKEVEERAVREREEAELAVQARIDAERVATEEKMRKELDREREALRIQLEAALAADREAMARANGVAAQPPTPPKPSLLDTVSGWFKREPRPRAVNLTTKRVGTNGTATKRPQAPSLAPRRNTPTPAQAKARKPRLLLLERRRGTAEAVLAKLRQRGVEISVVERWVDAADEMLRLRPDAFFLDVEHPDFDIVHKTTVDKSASLPIVLTGRSSGTAPGVRYAAFIARPYDVEEILRVAQQAMAKPEELLALQLVPRQPAARQQPPARQTAPKPAVVPAAPVGIRREAPKPAQVEAIALPAGDATNGDYDVTCFTCRVEFNAVEADWCSCLAKERSLVCTNCLSCFCKAPPAFKEKFWLEAPPRLFERKSAEARKQQGVMSPNAATAQVVRPLVLAVEDDEDIQAIVQRVCSNLGYGFVFAMNGQDGLDLAREYRPNLILTDAFMPKLDGREMCRQLKEDPSFTDTPMVVMTGLYTDTKYRSEALKRFRVDDYISKPVAITDLINLLQKHLEGVAGLPVQEDLHELHRKDIRASEDEDEMNDDDVTLAQVLAGEDSDVPLTPEVISVKRDGYDVSCFNCENLFDATHAEWCRCVGRDHTLVCTHCSGCFCKAPAAYKERFWIDAPPSLFERKMIGSKRNLGARVNPPASDVKRPLILLVEDDENVQLIVRTVVTTMGFGFVVGANGQEGLSLAREYSPELILSDAFMPKLDGREMCRLLKEDPMTSRSKAIIMTGLYTDRKYRNEALDYFKVDDYVAKPLAVDDLIKLFKKHLPQEVATAH